MANLSQNDIVGPVDQIHQSLLRHGHRTSGAVLRFLAPELWRQILLSPVGCKVGPPWIGHGSGEARSTSSALYHIFRAIPGQFFRTGRECLCYVGLYLISDGVWVGRMCQLGIHRTQSFPAEHCFVTRESLLFTSIFSG